MVKTMKKKVKVDELKDKINELSLEELKLLREHTSKQIERVKKKEKTIFTVYIPAEYRKDIEQAVAWAYRNGLIKRPTKWSFCKLAITNLTDLINRKIMEERIERIKTGRIPEAEEAIDIPPADSDDNDFQEVGEEPKIAREEVGEQCRASTKGTN